MWVIKDMKIKIRFSNKKVEQMVLLKSDFVILAPSVLCGPVAGGDELEQPENSCWQGYKCAPGKRCIDYRCWPCDHSC